VLRWLFLLAPCLAACEGAGEGPAAGEDRATATAAAPERPAAVKPRSPAAGACPLSIAFGSYAMGIDRPTFEAVEALLAADPAVASVERRGRGREGETELCAEVSNDAEAERLFHRIAGLLPPNPRGPVRVATRTGLTASAPAERR
jgi:hypothetical protein